MTRMIIIIIIISYKTCVSCYNLPSTLFILLFVFFSLVFIPPPHPHSSSPSSFVIRRCHPPISLFTFYFFLYFLFQFSSYWSYFSSFYWSPLLLLIFLCLIHCFASFLLLLLLPHPPYDIKFPGSWHRLWAMMPFLAIHWPSPLSNPPSPILPLPPLPNPQSPLLYPLHSLTFDAILPLPPLPSPQCIKNFQILA